MEIRGGYWNLSTTKLREGKGKREEVDWISLRKPRKLPDDILAEKEISAMIDASENLRDKALIAMLYEGGFFSSRRNQHISFNERTRN